MCVTSSAGSTGFSAAGASAGLSPGLPWGAGDAFFDVAADGAGDAFFDVAADWAGDGFLDATGDAAAFFFCTNWEWKRGTKSVFVFLLKITEHISLTNHELTISYNI